VEVRVGILPGRHDKLHIENHNNKHQLEIFLGTVIHTKDLDFLHHANMPSIRGLHIENHHNNSCIILINKNSIDLFHRTD
jgi:hypothetical protein